MKHVVLVPGTLELVDVAEVMRRFVSMVDDGRAFTLEELRQKFQDHILLFEIYGDEKDKVRFSWS